jgi:hypothetical protein
MPVFADPSGRRQRRVRLFAGSLGLACAAHLVIFVISFAGGPVGPNGGAGVTQLIGAPQVLDDTILLPGGEPAIIDADGGVVDPPIATVPSPGTQPVVKTAPPVATQPAPSDPRQPNGSPPLPVPTQPVPTPPIPAIPTPEQTPIAPEPGPPATPEPTPDGPDPTDPTSR